MTHAAAAAAPDEEEEEKKTIKSSRVYVRARTWVCVLPFVFFSDRATYCVHCTVHTTHRRASGTRRAECCYCCCH